MAMKTCYEYQVLIKINRYYFTFIIIIKVINMTI